MSKFLLLVVVAAACGDDPTGPTFSDAHPRIYLQTQKDRLATAFAANTPDVKKFKDITDRWVGGEDVYGYAPWNAALVGQLTGDPKYCAAAVAAVDKKVAAEEATIASGGTPDVASGDYYPAGDEVGNIAIVYDWCYDVVGDRRQAWLAFANQAVFNIWHPDTAMWGGKATSWTGWAVDDPGDNYYYNFLRATMLLGLAAHGEYDGVDAWLTQFHDTKLMNQLVPSFTSDLVGGGSREGTGYGVSLRVLWELFDIWKASTGEDLATKSPHTRASMLFFIHETVPALDRVAPTGDQSRDSTASFFDYHRNYLQELVTLFPTDPLAPRVQALLRDSTVPEMSASFMYDYDFIYANNDVAPTTLDGLGTAFYGSGTGQLFARSGWDKHATWINMNAGPYTQSHAHQDQGALMIFKDEWLAYDPCVDSHSGLPQDVEDHGTIRMVNGGSTVKQQNGSSTLLALHKGTGYLHAAADLAPVYGSSVSKLQREIIYLEPDVLVVYDRASSTAQQVWQLAFPKTPTINGMVTTVANGGHTLTIQRMSEAGATSTVHDYASDSDFITGFRLDETVPAGDHYWLHVIYIDNGVTTVTPVDNNTVDLVLAGGKTAHVAFNQSGVGGSLTLNGNAVTLGAGVDSLPE